MIRVAKTLREICSRYGIAVDLAIAICEYLGSEITLAQVLSSMVVLKKINYQPASGDGILNCSRFYGRNIKQWGEGTPALTVLIWKGNKETAIVCLFRPYDLRIMPPPMDTEATESLLTALAYLGNLMIFEAKFVSIQRIKATIYKGRPLVTSVSNSVCQSEPLVRIAQQYIRRHPAILETV